MDKMKYKLHLPTETYGFIEAELEGTHEEAVVQYRELSQEWCGSEGLSEGDFRKTLDKYLLTNKMESSEYEAMSTPQKNAIQMLKRAFKRIAAKND